MVRIENRKGGGAKLVSCDVDMRIRHDIDLVTFNLSRKCLSQPGRIRVAVKLERLKRSSGLGRVFTASPHG